LNEQSADVQQYIQLRESAKFVIITDAIGVGKTTYTWNVMLAKYLCNINKGFKVVLSNG